MQLITTANHPKTKWPGIKAWFGRDYDQFPVQWTDLFDQETSEQAYEEIVEDIGFGFGAIKPQGRSAVYDSDSQGYVTRFTALAYALGFMVTWEEMRDNLYDAVAKRRSPDLAFSMRQTKEHVLANIYNRAFNANYLGGDGKEWLATDHPSRIGSWSNELSTPADLSEAAIEDLLIMINTAQDSRGRKVAIKGQSLHIPPALDFEAHRILKSVLQNDTSNNAVNALKATGALPKGVKINQYFTSDTAWFVRTNARRGAIHFQRDPMDFSEDGEFDNKVQKYMAYERYSAGWANPKGLYGSAGA
jgi:hypothetical protein